MKEALKRVRAERRLRHMVDGGHLRYFVTTDGQYWYPTQSGYEMAVECEMAIIEEEQDERV